MQACQLLWAGSQCLNSIRKECTKSAITSQAVATRANMDEWRQCLQFASQWHQTSLQGAYRLWQSQSLAVLAPPASQWMKVESGQPMYPSDAHLAGHTITSVKLAQIAVEARLTEYHELAVHHKAGVAELSEQRLQLIDEVDQLYMEFLAGYARFANSDQGQQNARLLRLSSQLDQFDKAFYSRTTQ